MMYGTEFHMYMSNTYTAFSKKFMIYDKNTYAYFLTDMGIISEEKYGEMLGVEEFKWIHSWEFQYKRDKIYIRVKVSKCYLNGGIYENLKKYFDENPNLLDFYLI